MCEVCLDAGALTLAGVLIPCWGCDTEHDPET